MKLQIFVDKTDYEAMGFISKFSSPDASEPRSVFDFPNVEVKLEDLQDQEVFHVKLEPEISQSTEEPICLILETFSLANFDENSSSNELLNFPEAVKNFSFCENEVTKESINLSQGEFFSLRLKSEENSASEVDLMQQRAIKLEDEKENSTSETLSEELDSLPRPTSYSPKTPTPNKNLSTDKMRKKKLKQKFGPKCIVPCCGYKRPTKHATSSPRRTLFQFSKKLAKDWVGRIEGLEQKDVKLNSKICDVHFDPKFITRRKSKNPKFYQLILSPDALPTLNLQVHKEKNAKSPIDNDDKQLLVEILKKSDRSMETGLPPPAPLLKKFKIQTGIKLCWDMTLTDEHEKVKSFELFASKDEILNIKSFKKIGEVQAVSLQMSCDLNSRELTEGQNYNFFVRAVDVRSRFGKFSNVCKLN